MRQCVILCFIKSNLAVAYATFFYNHKLAMANPSKMGVTMKFYHFGNKTAPVIHSFDMEHEELLVLRPEQWIEKVKEVCL